MPIVSLQTEKMIRELPTKTKIDSGYDWLIIEGKDGTRKMRVEDFLANSLIGNLFFDNVDEMCASNNLKEGSIVFTKGFYTAGDGGAAKYEIKYDPGTPTNGSTVLELKISSTLKAFIDPEEYVCPEQLGAIGDGVVDDSGVIKKLLELKCPIRLTPNKKYKLEQNISLPNNSCIEFNNASFILDGTTINVKDVSNVIIDELNIDCSNNGRGLYVFKSKNVIIMRSRINNIRETLSGIEISESSNVHVYDNSFSNMSVGGRGIYIHGDYNVEGENTNIINIDGCNFSSVKEPIYIDGLVVGVGRVAISRCYMEYANNNIGNAAITNNAIQSNISIDDITVKNGYQVLSVGYGSKSSIFVGNINAINTEYIYSLGGTRECFVHLYGGHNYKSDSEEGRYVVKVMDTTLSIDATFNIKGYNLLNTGYAHSGFLTDNTDTKNCMALKHTVDLDATTGTLYIRDFKNAYYNIVGSTNLMVIEKGIEGQIIEVVSSDDLILKNISSSIVLPEPGDITLHKYKGVKLIYLEGKWIQI